MKSEVSIILNGFWMPDKIDGGFIICADGGYRLLKKRGITPDIIIGDNDSIKAADVPRNIARIDYKAQKDMTDGELCIRYAAAQGYRNIAVFGALGGRQDHVEANLALLSIAYKLGAEAVIYDENTEIHYTEGLFSARVSENLFISLVPFDGFSHIIETRGLKYSLKNTRLYRRSTLGISNVSDDSGEIFLKLKHGGVFVFINRPFSE